jgi:hypothetical protein
MRRSKASVRHTDQLEKGAIRILAGIPEAQTTFKPVKLERQLTGLTEHCLTRD